MKRAPRVTKRQHKDRRCVVCKKEPRTNETDVCMWCLHTARRDKAARRAT